jgi:hypothetical protein
VDNYGTGTISVTYDPAVVHVTDVSDGPDSTVIDWNPNNSTGIVIISAWNMDGVSGNIIFANVTFKAVGTGSTPLNLSVTTLKDIFLHDIPAIIKNGSFKEWQAETHNNENYYQLKLNSGVDIDTAELLQFEVTNPAHSQSNTTFHTVTLEEINLRGVYNFNFTLNPYIFDTGEGTYPSIFGVHRGNFTPTRNITVHQMYTYPCAGTGGHSESIELYENNTLIANGTWNGYQGDWHNIIIHNVAGATYLTLLQDHEYNYTIHTGSYPQILHAREYKAVEGGNITCTEFIDANGNRYEDWIPAIRLYVE